MVRISMVMPPTEGMAMGTMMSEPRPVEVRMGIRARIVVAVVIFGVGLFLSRIAYKTISPTGQGPSALLGNVARIAILVFTGAMALFRAGLASEIVTLAFGAVIVGLALAAALAFGLGGREEAAKIVADWRAKS